MPAPVVSILNMKGGVGKTTVSAHVMRVLYHRMKKKVLLIDLDAQFNLTQSVLTQDEYDTILNSKKTVLKCFEPSPSSDFFQVKHSDNPPPNSNDISRILRKFGNGDTARLDMIPGAFDLMKYSMIDDARQLKYASDYMKRFMSQARQQYDLIVLDCNPSSSFVTKCALENSTHVISPIKLDKFSILGVGMVDELFTHLNLNLSHMILINDVKRSNPMSQIELELRAHPKFGPNILINRLFHSKLLSAEPTYTGFATDRKGPYSSVLRQEISRLSQEISDRLGIR
ncbi:ParA family protein [Acetobacter ghanensis]|uniref:AAA family ATPase n=1 Tax=Acetobacter ghanensis TaxID=431306 RepID=A0ABX0KK55_9PROT|nr:ParA family protein [Acetobacter ghanensis]NHO40494.1 AAA family ATPase [Acetobacter ghanensis]GBQ46858.1 cobyrinic acid ac-diamide synthase [Acetobacter ghanensis DSM 18895]